jgi:hypothetical protein
MFDRWKAGLDMQRARMEQQDQQFMARTMVGAMQQQAANQQAENMLRLRNQLGQDLFDYEMTEKQKQKFDALNAELDWIDEQPDWDEDQKAYARDVVRTKMLGASRPRMIPKQQTKPIEEIFKASSHVDENGVTYLRNPDGTWKTQMPPKQEGDDSAKVQAEKVKNAAKMFENLMKLTTEKFGEKTPKFTQDEAMELAYSHFGLPIPTGRDLSGAELMSQMEGRMAQNINLAIQGLEAAAQQGQPDPQMDPVRRAQMVISRLDLSALNEGDMKIYQMAKDMIDKGQVTQSVMVALQRLYQKAGTR